MQDPREVFRRAVDRLVEDPDADRLHDSILTVARLSTQHPVALAGDAQDLNILLTLAVKHPRSSRRPWS